jgi:hypothetical protein
VSALLYITLLLADIGLVSATGAAYVQLGMFVVVAIYGTFLAGVGLQIPTGTALSLVVLDLVLSMTTDQLVRRIY